MTDSSIHSFIVDSQGIARCPCCGKRVCIPCTAGEGHVVTHPKAVFAKRPEAIPYIPLEQEA